MKNPPASCFLCQGKHPAGRGGKLNFIYWFFRNLFYFYSNKNGLASCIVPGGCFGINFHFDLISSFFQALLHGDFSVCLIYGKGRASGYFCISQSSFAACGSAKCKHLGFLTQCAVGNSLGSDLCFQYRSCLCNLDGHGLCCCLVACTCLCGNGNLYSSDTFDGNFTFAVYGSNLCVGRLVGQSCFCLCAKVECFVPVFLGNNTFGVLYGNSDGLCFDG